MEIKFISLLLILCLVSISAVSAAENMTDDLSIADSDIEEIVNDDIITSDANSTFTDLNNQIKNANTGDTIVLDSNYDYDTEFNYVYGIRIDKSITIDGAGNAIDGKNTARIFQISADNVVLKNIRFINGFYSTVGGAVRCDADGLTIDNCSFENNHAQNSNGGAVFINGNGAVITNSEFSKNTAKNSGGAVRVNGGQTLIENNVFSKNNAATAGGGAVCILGSDANTVKNNTFSDNIAGRDGGALDLELGIGNVVESNTFTKNIAMFGGAIAIYGSEFDFKNNRFTNNLADIGGAIRVNSTIKEGVSSIERNIIENNVANSTGGALFLVGNYINVSKNTFTNNKALKYGGGSINSRNSNYTYILNNVIDGSSTKENGGSVVITGNNAEIISNNISNSNAGKSGGAIYLDGNNAKITDNCFKNTAANDSSGALRLNTENSEISNNKFINSSASTNGGSAFITGDKNSILFNDFNSTKADVGGALRIEGDSNTINGNYFSENSAEIGQTVYLNGNQNKFNKNTVINTAGEASVKNYGTNDISGNYYFDSKNLKNTTKLAANGITVKYNTGKYLTALLTDLRGNPLAGKEVAITINGKTYKKTTNSKGQVSLKIGLAPKTYTATISFAGDDSFSASKTTAKVVVKKVAPKLKVAKKTFKLKKTKKITATLKDNNGKVLKSKKISFKINGKKYTAKTNKKGVATVKVKLNKRATYKVVVKFAGDKYFTALSKSNYIKVK